MCVCVSARARDPSLQWPPTIVYKRTSVSGPCLNGSGGCLAGWLAGQLHRICKPTCCCQGAIHHLTLPPTHIKARTRHRDTKFYTRWQSLWRPTESTNTSSAHNGEDHPQRNRGTIKIKKDITLPEMKHRKGWQVLRACPVPSHQRAKAARFGSRFIDITPPTTLKRLKRGDNGEQGRCEGVYMPLNIPFIFLFHHIIGWKLVKAINSFPYPVSS